MFVSRSTIAQTGLCLFLFIGFANAQPHWALTSVSGPSPRQTHGMVYDSCRGVVVLFGGVDESGVLSDTWEWNGIAWSLRATTGPAARGYPSMAFDSDRCVTVLFGGSHSSAYLNDTWEWNGTTWTERCTGGCTRPGVRQAAGMTYDSVRDRVVLFGGSSATAYNSETWIYDGSAGTWTQLTTNTPPSPRNGVGMVFDSAVAKVILFGGYVQPVLCGTMSDETWVLDLADFPTSGAWTLLNPSTHPPTRADVGMAYDPNRNRTILFGGVSCVTTSAETWEWNGANWTKVADDVPPKRGALGMAYDATRNEIVVFGGERSWLAGGPPDRLGDTWSYGNRAYSIPALGTWGLGVTTLLLLCAGTLVATRRRVAVRLT